MSIQNGEANAITLECGTSLAELEYTTEIDQKQRQQEERKDDQKYMNHDHAMNKDLKSDIQQKLNFMISSLSNDVVTCTKHNSPISMFTSPYETPKSRNSTGQTDIPEAERYASLPLIYCDQTASNRPLKSIEKFIHETCLPLYGNTHTNTSVTGSQSTAFVAEARQIVAEGVNAKISGKAALDVVLFAGNGTTSAVELLVDCLGMKNGHVTDNDNRPVVFVGPYEHHSNLIPWRESGCEIVMIPECQESQDVDVKYLEMMLTRPNYNNRVKIGTFTAASNVTGKVSDVNIIAATLHKYGALAFFDYATGCSYLPMDMNPPPSSCGKYTSRDIAKDAIFLSPHKMIGGINTPGVLIMKKHLVNQTNAPGRSGGGTVFYVTHTHHRFLSNRIERYEGGTPNVVGIMRTGLTFLVKRKMEVQYTRLIKNMQEEEKKDGGDNNDKERIPKSILEHDYWTHSYIVETLSRTAPNIVFLGAEKKASTSRNLPIFAFLVKCGERFLHYNYVCAILNDLFGIQSRGGCQCSGPYSQHLLGLTKIENGKEVPSQANEAIENALLHYKERAELLRPGYSRLSLPFKGLRREEVEYVLKALEWVSKHAWALMCQYRCNHRTGEWRHFSRQGKPLGRTERRWLSHFDLASKEIPTKNGSEKSLKDILENAFENANYQLEVAQKEQRYIMQALKMSDDSEILNGDDNLEKLRWYVYPKECAQILKKGLSVVPGTYSTVISGAIRPHGLNESTPLDSKAFYVEEPPTISVKELNENENFRFRNGECHTGDATFDEIFDGFNDGELSDNCVVFVSYEDDWLPIEKFLEKRKKSKNNDKIDDERMVSQIDLNAAMSNHINHVDSSREKKKPSRDSSSWGKTTSVADTLSSSMNTSKEGSSKSIVKTSELDSKQKMHPSHANGSNKRKKGNSNHIRPPQKLMKYVIQGVMQFDMIQEGDRLLLGLSGGKDSLSLLHCLLELKRKLKTNFEIEVCTIDPMTPSFDPSPLIPYVESLGLKYHYVKDNIVERANSGGKNGTVVTSLCAYCARMKRGNLYATARKHNCNKLVLAQHLDDCAESCFMSMMHNGFIRTMKSKYEINAGDLSVIRPLCYCRESLMTDFAKQNNLPVINENCPACFEEPKERARVKKLLSREETLYPNIYDNIRRSLIPIMHDDMTGILRCYTEEAVSRSRKVKGHGKKKKRNNQNRIADDIKNDDIAAVNLETNNCSKDGSNAVNGLLSTLSDEELLKEMARRKSQRFRFGGSMKSKCKEEKSEDLSSQPCDEPTV